MALALAMGIEDLGCEMALFAYTPYGFAWDGSTVLESFDIRYG
jgi:hypothetical protein